MLTVVQQAGYKRRLAAQPIDGLRTRLQAVEGLLAIHRGRPHRKYAAMRQLILKEFSRRTESVLTFVRGVGDTIASLSTSEMLGVRHEFELMADTAIAGGMAPQTQALLQSVMVALADAINKRGVK